MPHSGEVNLAAFGRLSQSPQYLPPRQTPPFAHLRGTAAFGCAERGRRRLSPPPLNAVLPFRQNCAPRTTSQKIIPHKNAVSPKRPPPGGTSPPLCSANRLVSSPRRRPRRLSQSPQYLPPRQTPPFAHLRGAPRSAAPNAAGGGFRRRPQT